MKTLINYFWNNKKGNENLQGHNTEQTTSKLNKKIIVV